MLAEVQSGGEIREAAQGPATAGRVTPVPRIEAARDLATGAVLFREGESKDCIYRIEKGVICLFRSRPGRTAEPVGFAFAGDLVGLGALDRHMWSAQASVETRVSRLPREAAEAIADLAPHVRRRHDEASEREFALLRDDLAARGQREASARLAALLLVISDNNVSEGRCRDVIEDDLSCGLVAGMLELELGTLAQALLELAGRGLVRASEGGALRILDRRGLERLVEGT